MAYNFTAANSQYLNTGSTPVTSTPLTIAAWFYPTADANGTICSVGVTSGTNRQQLFYDPTSFAGAKLSANSLDNSGQSESNRSGVVELNAWQHGAGVYTSSTERLAYHNGNAGTVNTVSRIPSGLNTITIGGRWNTAIGGLVTGRIAEVGIWNAALTAAEIASLAKGMTCDKVRPQNLVFYAPLVRDLKDQKGGLAITNNNGATVATHPRVYA